MAAPDLQRLDNQDKQTVLLSGGIGELCWDELTAFKAQGLSFCTSTAMMPTVLASATGLQDQRQQPVLGTGAWVRSCLTGMNGDPQSLS